MSVEIKVCKKGLHEYQGKKCRACDAARMAAKRARDPEKYRAIDAARYSANRQKILAQNATWRAKNPERVAALKKGWDAANPVKARERRSRWELKNPDKVRDKATRGNLKIRTILSDGYVAQTIGLRLSQIPQELIELKRVQLRITRKLKELKK